MVCSIEFGKSYCPCSGSVSPGGVYDEGVVGGAKKTPWFAAGFYCAESRRNAKGRTDGEGSDDKCVHQGSKR